MLPGSRESRETLAMKTLLSATALTAVFAGAAMAQNYEVSLFGGYNDGPALFWEDSDYDTDLTVFGGVRVERLDAFMPGLDVGLDYSYLAYVYTCCSNDINGHSLMVTGSYGTEIADGLTAYGTLGLGVTRVSYVNSGSTFSDTVLSGMAAVGLSYDIGQVSVFGEVRHMGITRYADVAFGDPADFYGTLAVLGVSLPF